MVYAYSILLLKFIVKYNHILGSAPFKWSDDKRKHLQIETNRFSKFKWWTFLILINSYIFFVLVRGLYENVFGNAMTSFLCYAWSAGLGLMVLLPNGTMFKADSVLTIVNCILN